MEEFSALSREGATILLVSHDLDSLKYGTKIFKMAEGKIADGSRLAAK